MTPEQHSRNFQELVRQLIGQDPECLEYLERMKQEGLDCFLQIDVLPGKEPAAPKEQPPAQPTKSFEEWLSPADRKYLSALKIGYEDERAKA